VAFAIVAGTHLALPRGTRRAAILELTLATAGTLQLFSDPNVAYVVLTVGLIGVVAGLQPGTPALVVPGALALIVAFVALGTLPVRWGAVIALSVGVGLQHFDLPTRTMRMQLLAGTLVFVIGSLLLFDQVRVDAWLIGCVTAVCTTLAIVMHRVVRAARDAPVAIGREALLGSNGVAVSDLAPTGTVRVDGTAWTAVADDGPVPAGEGIRVTGVEGLRLRVRRA